VRAFTQKPKAPRRATPATAQISTPPRSVQSQPTGASWDFSRVPSTGRHTVQRQGGGPILRREPPESQPPTRPDLETRLQIIEETGPATQSRLDQIIRTGGPVPSRGTKVIGAAIIDVVGYEGPKEMRAINGTDADALGQGAGVYHAQSPSPTTRTLSATQGRLTAKGGREASILGPHNESIFPHLNDAEMKLFEDIISRLPKGAKGTIHFTTVRVRQVGGQTVIEPYPACSGCIRASFETAGMLAGVDLVSHAPVRRAGTADLGEPPVGAGTEVTPPAQAAKAPTTAGKTTPSAKAEVGAPLEPVVEATPGLNTARGTAIGGAVQLIQAMQIAGLQRAEVEKFENRYNELLPKIEVFLNKRYSVELTLIVERPNTVDIGCRTGAFCDSGQLTYFHALYISRAESIEPVIRPAIRDTTHATIGPVGGRDSVIPYTHEGGSLIEEREIPHLSTRDKYHHTVSAKHMIYPQPEFVMPATPARRPPATPAQPPLDAATRAAMAVAPSRVYVLSENINQHKTALKVMEKLRGNPLFGEVKEYVGGGLGRTRTVVVYFSDLDKPRAEALAEVVRAVGLPADAEMSGTGSGAPGSVQIMFGRDAE
jgi:hypothetical protein